MQNPIVKLIDGTASTQSYCVVGKKGKAVLGIKPLGLMDGKYTGASGKTYFHCRLRSADGSDLFEDETDGKVTALKGSNDWSEYWPNIKFNKNDETRASAIFGAYIDGSIEDNPQAVLDAFDNGSLIEELMNSVIDMIGEENLAIRKGALLHWLHEKLDPAIEAYKAKLKIKAAQQEYLDENGGSFGFHQAAMMDIAKQNKIVGDEDDDEAVAATLLSAGKAELVKAVPEEASPEVEETVDNSSEEDDDTIANEDDDQ